MSEDSGGMFAPLRGGGKPARRAPKKTGWVPLVPVPETAPPAPETHYKRGRPSAVYTYRGPDGRVWGHVCRFDTAGGGKDFLPLAFCENREAGKTEWRWKALPTPRPLYGLDRLASHPGAPVVVCEGEKAADAAGELLPEWVAVTSPGGSLASGKADWGVLAGRPVTVWRDADGPGMKYALAVAGALGRIGVGRVALVTPPEGAAPGWDAADALAEGWDTARTLGLVEAARPASEVMQEAHGSGARAVSDGQALKDELQEGGASRRRSGPPQRDTVGGLIDDAELWHSPDGEAFVTLPLDGHVENWGVRSRMFKVWLCGRHYDVHGAAPGGQAVEDALRVMEAQAIHRGPEYPTFLRVGKDGGAVYIDLGGPDWRAVKVTGADWEVVDLPPVKFVRSAHARPLPMPERGESVDRLRGLVNCGDSDFVLIVAWLVASLRPESPYPILIVGGEQGTAKSSLTRALRSLVDPNAAPIRTAPRDERDLLIAARNAWVLAYDNVSGVPEWFSNALCRLSTGGGMGVRQLFTDWEETVFSGERPVILNGIGDLASRPDLADRAVMVTLRPIPDDERRTEREWRKTFEEEAPYILGALFDGVSAALRGLPETAVDRRPRMADFAQWMVAAEPGLGWEEGSFLPVYLANREEAVQASLEADPIAQAVLKMVEEDMAGHGRWEGSATELLPVLEDHVSENVKKSRFWPKTASMLSKRLTQAATILRANGVEIERVKGGRDSRRTIIIRPKAAGEG